MKYYYENTVYSNKRKNQLTCTINYTSKGKRVWLQFGVKISPKGVEINNCYKNHYLNRLCGFLEEADYKEYIPEVEEKAKELYQKYFK